MKSALALVLLCALGACTEEPGAGAPHGALGRAMALAAEQAQLPSELLYALVDTEQGFDASLQRELPYAIELPQAGPLHLRHGSFDSLAAAAARAGTSELELQRDGALALRSGAQVLASMLEERGLQLAPGVGLVRGEWSALLDVLGQWSGYADGWHQRDYARRVLAALARGSHTHNRFGEELRSAPLDVPPALLLPEPRPIAPAALPEFDGAEVFPLPASKPNKFEPGRPDGASVQFVVIHDTEGGWDGSVATLQNSDSTSVHYIIGRDGRIAQFMPEADTGKHSGNVYYNRRSIGIEHVGYSTQHYPQAQYEKSTELVVHLAAKYQVPLDRAHIIGHDQVPSDEDPEDVAADGPPCDRSPAECASILYYGGRNHHTDPGVWEWGVFLHRVGGHAKCNDVEAALVCDTTLDFAVGCLNGADVTVLECQGGCRDAVDDEYPLQCRQDPRAIDGGASSSGSTGSSGTGNGGNNGASGGSSGGSNGGKGSSSGAAGADAGAEADGEDGGGCHSAPRASVDGVWLAALALLAARRKDRTSPRAVAGRR